MPIKVSEEDLIQTKQALESCHGSVTEAAKLLNLPRSTLAHRKAIIERREDITKTDLNGEKRKVKQSEDTIEIDYVGTSVVSPDQLVEDAKIDLDMWEVYEVNVNNWEVGGKISKTNKGQQLWKMPLRQIKIKLRKKSCEKVAIESLLAMISDSSKKVPLIKRKKPSLNYPKLRRSLEISIMDPHFGLQCYKPSSDMQWSLEECEELCMWAIDDLLRKAKNHGPFEEIIFPFGNDYMHHDSMRHDTTKGTPQPEGLSWSYIYERAEILAINMVERLKAEANVKVLSIPGNHDHHSSYTLARVLNAYYRNDKNVIVDADSSPYKFYRYGVNLVGFEHGHHISNMRLPALMANERPSDWADTIYREWHLGDQHRKGTGKPSSMEEQGVSVEYLPALTPPNQWHKLKGFNWQKRGAMAFVWDYNTGPEARLQSNINTYTGLAATK